MKKKVFFLLLFIVSNLQYAQEKSIDFIKTYEGETRDGQSFYMKLKCFSGQVSGNMFMKNKCQSLKIDGYIKQDRTFKIDVFDAAGSYIYNFIGTSENNNKLKGDFKEYKNESTFFALSSSDNFDTVLINCNTIKETVALNTFVIDKLTLLSFPPTKSNGKSWDNYLTGYKADVYFEVTNQNNKSLYNMSPNYYTDITTANLPLILNKQNIKFSAKSLNGRICVSFYDYDSVTDHDNLGGACFSVEKNITNSTPKKQRIKVEGIEFIIEYHFER